MPNIDALLDAFYHYMEATFHSRQIKALLPTIDPNLTGFGTGADEIMLPESDAVAFYERDFSQADISFDVTYDMVEPTLLSADVGLVMSTFAIRGILAGQPLVYDRLRLSTIFHKQEADWKLVHMHVSTPAVDQERGESYPLAKLEAQNKLLAEKVAAQTAVLAEQERSLNTLLQNLPGMVYRCRVDENWTMLFVSQGAQTLTGYSPDALQDNKEVSFGSLILAEDRQLVMDAVEAGIRNNRSFELTYRIRRRDGEVRWVWEQGRNVAYETDDVPILEGFIQDITPQRQVELQNEGMLADLARSNKDLQQFAYAASHDLQEPLRMVTTFLELLAKEYAPELGEEGKTYINFALDGSQRMRALIQGLLNFARVDSRGQPFTAVDMRQVLDEIAIYLKPTLQELNGRLDITTPLPIIWGDRPQIVQLVQNIVSNALKYRTDEPPLVRIAAEVENGHYHFTVQDNGIGIAAKHHDRIFVIFQRLHTQQEVRGSGIGLAVCKRIIDRHNGRIWVASEPGSGATFHFTLPAWQPADREQAPQPPG